jgi:hypothetical protein
MECLPGAGDSLRNKINTYAGYITGGDLVDAYPEAAGNPVRIQLHCVQEPTARIATVVQHAPLCQPGLRHLPPDN